MLEASDILSVSSLCLYTKFDAFQLEQIIGTSRLGKMISNDSQSTYLFC